MVRRSSSSRTTRATPTTRSARSICSTAASSTKRRCNACAPTKTSASPSTRDTGARRSKRATATEEPIHAVSSPSRNVLSTTWQDFQYALRALVRRPMYAAVTVVVLAIAIGANTTVFSVVNGLFLRPLPYPDGDRLVMVYDSYTKVSNLANSGTAIPDYIERREQAKSLESLAITAGVARTLGGEGEPLRLLTRRASASLFSVLRVAPAVGRGFTDEEEKIGNDRVVVLSDGLWRARFGASTSVIGRDILL